MSLCGSTGSPCQYERYKTTMIWLISLQALWSLGLPGTKPPIKYAYLYKKCMKRDSLSGKFSNENEPCFLIAARYVECQCFIESPELGDFIAGY